MFLPNLTCTITSKGTRDIYGQEVVGASHTERCAIVKLVKESFHTTVRADSSASRGHGDEFRVDCVILLTKTTKVKIDDKLTVAGVSIRVKSVFPRVNVNGTLDHYQVEGELWE
jgi:hypothetical protein